MSKIRCVSLGGIMRDCLVFACLAGLTSLALAQKPALPVKPGESRPSNSISADSGLKDLFEAKIKLEWQALKNKDKKAYAELLADDYEGVEVDGRGERNKIQAVNEVEQGNVFNYTFFGFRVTPLGPDAAFVIYEVTIEFPPKAQVRFLRVYVGEVWVKRAGQWKVQHYQETSVK
jgi:hypothetical protein